MAVNADDIRPEEPEDGVHEPNSYFKAFDTIVAELDELAKVLTPDESDDGDFPDGDAAEVHGAADGEPANGLFVVRFDVEGILPLSQTA